MVSFIQSQLGEFSSKYMNCQSGFPAAWMISSNATEVTIDFLLATVQGYNPMIHPEKFMTDFDWGQINSIRRRYPLSQVLLCWWHVLHAWIQHIVVAHYCELWELLKNWIRIEEEATFKAQWLKIQKLAPESFIEYITRYWMPVKNMWSGVERKRRNILQLCDTNMLVEA